jgi:hypothetical protein
MYIDVLAGSYAHGSADGIVDSLPEGVEESTI